MHFFIIPLSPLLQASLWCLLFLILEHAAKRLIKDSDLSGKYISTINSFMHAAFVVIGSMPPVGAGYTEAYGLPICEKHVHFIAEAAQLHAISVGYFFWDLLYTMGKAEYAGLAGVMFKLHAVFCLTVYSISIVMPFALHIGREFLLWEISTIPLDIFWLLQWSKPKGIPWAKIWYKNFHKFNVLMLWVLFGVFRLYYGLPVSFEFFWELVECNTTIGNLIYIPTLVVLNALNLVWFYKMCFKVWEVIFETDYDAPVKFLYQKTESGGKAKKPKKVTTKPKPKKQTVEVKEPSGRTVLRRSTRIRKTLK